MPPKAHMAIDWQGNLTKAPSDYANVIATVGDSEVVWSFNGRIHKVRYGLQVVKFVSDMAASHEFGECVRHWAECNGKFD